MLTLTHWLKPLPTISDRVEMTDEEINLMFPLRQITGHGLPHHDNAEIYKREGAKEYRNKLRTKPVSLSSSDIEKEFEKWFASNKVGFTSTEKGIVRAGWNAACAKFMGGYPRLDRAVGNTKKHTITDMPQKEAICNICHQYVTRLNEIGVDDALKLQVLSEFADALLGYVGEKVVEIKDDRQQNFTCPKCEALSDKYTRARENVFAETKSNFCPSCGSKITWK